MNRIFQYDIMGKKQTASQLPAAISTMRSALWPSFTLSFGFILFQYGSQIKIPQQTRE